MEILMPVIIVAIIGIIAGVLLSFASKYMAVPTDERYDNIRSALPGANCGACGFSGCDGYAAAIASGEAEPNKCTPGGKNTAEALAKILGVEVASDTKIAFIACKGRPQITKSKYAYSGLQSCLAASSLCAGPSECSFGCVNFGDCAKACPFGAIIKTDGGPFVCEDICVGCGKCINACPKSLISLIPKNHKNTVNCSNKARGVSVVTSCDASCIACHSCERVCKNGAIRVVNNLAVVDYLLCDGCGSCKTACKRGVLI